MINGNTVIQRFSPFYIRVPPAQFKNCHEPLDKITFFLLIKNVILHVSIRNFILLGTTKKK